jgi:hypothetical protein
MGTFADDMLPLLRTLPRPLAALLLQQGLRYEWMFPRERAELEETLKVLRDPRSEDSERAVQGFVALKVPASVQLPDWERQPAAFAEAFTAAMWSSDQIGSFRNAAKQLIGLQARSEGGGSRAVVIVMDAGLHAENASASLFRRLRSVGTHFTSVPKEATSGSALQRWIAARGASDPTAYAHWVVSGDDVLKPLPADPIVVLTYAGLKPARQHLLGLMNQARSAQTAGGPEGLRSAMMAMRPEQIGLQEGTDPVLSAFATEVLVSGSGTQLYSTTFVQWVIREALRRAQPSTIVARFTPRSRSASMDVRLSRAEEEPPLDPAGSLVDAEMHTYMSYVNLLRLGGAERSHFLVWHEGYGQALLVGPGVSAGQTERAKTNLAELLTRMA